MTKLELINDLEGFDDDAEVHFVYDYGDRHHTDVASVVGETEEGTIVWSEYHRDFKVVDAEDHDDDVAHGRSREREVKSVILLRAH